LIVIYLDSLSNKLFLHKVIFRRNNKDYYTLHVNKEENKMDEHPELTE